LPFHDNATALILGLHMKTLLRLSPILFAVAFARADVVVEQKMESAMINGNVTTKIKGDHARMDMPSPVGGNITTVMDFKSGEMVTFMHAQKLAMKMNLNDMKKQQEAAQKAQGIDLDKIEKPKATGQTEKVGEYNAEIFEMNLGGMTAKFWVSKDYPNAKAINEQMKKLTSGMAQMGFDPNKFDLPGLVVKTEMGTPAGKMTVTVVSAKETPVADSEFTRPEGYQEMTMPSLPGAGAPPAAPAPKK